MIEMATAEVQQFKDLNNQTRYQRCSDLVGQINARKKNQSVVSLLPPTQNPIAPPKRYALKETDSVKNARLTSYATWPHCTPSRELMSLNGWFYCKVNDRTLCMYCDTICHDWKTTDDPHEVHARLAPDCPFVLSLPSPVSKNSPSFIDGTMTSKFEACHANMCEMARRQETFNNPSWTQTSPSAEELALAGFFYSGTGNSVACFYCNGSLHKWSENDSPKVEHARWFPNCQYAKHLCGDRLHADIQTVKKRRLSTEKNSINKETLMRLVNARLDLPVVQRLRNTYSLSIIKRCIEEQLKAHEDDFKSDNDLAMDCLILQKQMDIIQGKPENIITPSQNQTPVTTSEVSNTKLDDCLICLTEERQLACMPCGHLCACVSCGYALRTCPICRQKIQSFVRIYC